MERSRQHLLAALGAPGAAALRRRAQSQRATNLAPRRIDVHCHFSSPGFIEAIKARNTRLRWAAG